MSLLARLRTMDAHELRTRGLCEARKAAGRLRWSIAPRRWRHRDLAALLTPDASGAVAAATRALRNDDSRAAHRALAAHFASRARKFVLDPRMLDELRDRI